MINELLDWPVWKSSICLSIISNRKTNGRFINKILTNSLKAMILFFTDLILIFFWWIFQGVFNEEQLNFWFISCTYLWLLKSWNIWHQRPLLRTFVFVKVHLIPINEFCMGKSQIFFFCRIKKVIHVWNDMMVIRDELSFKKSNKRSILMTFLMTSMSLPSNSTPN